MTNHIRMAACMLSLIMITASMILPGRIEASECGDVDLSGRVVATDALLVLKKAVGSASFTCPTGLPATGQMTAYGTGSDGDVQAGAVLSYVDNGDGTITDNTTGLMWEKKDDNPTPTIHDKDNIYSWSTGTNDMDGTITTVFLDTLNDVDGGGASCFAGHCDWRIPNSKALYSLLNQDVRGPAVDLAFHQSATCTGCTDVKIATCSCTASVSTWSATTDATSPVFARYVHFDAGNDLSAKKDTERRVRAVRGGL